MRPFHSIADIAGLWKSIAACGRDIGVKPSTMRKYVTGERAFPVEKIDALVRSARARPGGERVTHERVCRLISLAVEASQRRVA